MIVSTSTPACCGGSWTPCPARPCSRWRSQETNCRIPWGANLRVFRWGDVNDLMRTVRGHTRMAWVRVWPRTERSSFFLFFPPFSFAQIFLQRRELCDSFSFLFSFVFPFFRRSSFGSLFPRSLSLYFSTKRCTFARASFVMVQNDVDANDRVSHHAHTCYLPPSQDLDLSPFPHTITTAR